MKSYFYVSHDGSLRECATLGVIDDTHLTDLYVIEELNESREEQAA